MVEKVLSFEINGNLFGIKVILIKEINRNVEFTMVPCSKPHIAGLFNMRGQVVTLFDLSILFGINETAASKKTTSIILKSGVNDPNQFGLLIDDVVGVIDMNSDDCESPPANFVGIECSYISKVLKLDDRLLLMLDHEKIYQQST